MYGWRRSDQTRPDQTSINEIDFFHLAITTLPRLPSPPPPPLLSNSFNNFFVCHNSCFDFRDYVRLCMYGSSVVSQRASESNFRTTNYMNVKWRARETFQMYNNMYAHTRLYSTYRFVQFNSLWWREIGKLMICETQLHRPKISCSVECADADDGDGSGCFANVF